MLGCMRENAPFGVSDDLVEAMRVDLFSKKGSVFLSHSGKNPTSLNTARFSDVSSTVSNIFRRHFFDLRGCFDVEFFVQSKHPTTEAELLI